MSLAASLDLSGHIALVTGANHGIGAGPATARTLASHGAAALVTYLSIHDEYNPGIPDTYRPIGRRMSGTLIASIKEAGGHVHPLRDTTPCSRAPVHASGTAHRS